MTYRPIDCGLHDELLLRALRGGPVGLHWIDADGMPHEDTDRIADVSSRGGAEYLTTAGGLEIRLDRLTEVDGIAFGGAG